MAVFKGSGVIENKLSLAVQHHTEKCPVELKELVDATKNAWDSYYDARLYTTNQLEKIKEERERLDSAILAFRRAIENAIRAEKGLPKIGEGWVSETILYQMIKHLFPDDRVIFHYRCPELNRLELDIFVSEKNIAIEYQGIQHYEPVGFWGGEEAFKKQVRRDVRKAKLCQELGITMVYFTYKDRLSSDLVEQRLSAWLSP